jgi:hypothetical protein
MSENLLQTSKKRKANGKWSYRGYVIEKEKSKWKIVKGELKDNNSIKIYELDSKKTIKEVCLSIDKILGNLSSNNKLKNKRKNNSKKINNEKLSEAKKIAYDVRKELENILEKNNKNFELKGKLAIPYGKGKDIGDNGFILTWNKKFDVLDIVLKNIQEKNPNVNFKTKEDENKTELTVLIKE